MFATPPSRALPAEAGLPLWLRPFEVVVTSRDTALIELVPDALSVHTIKARTAAALAPGSSTAPEGPSLSDHFFARWQRGSDACAAAQRRFAESLAGYSLVCYLLQASGAVLECPSG